MKTYSLVLFQKLVEVFPEALNYSRTVELFEDRPGPWGMERINAGYETENLGEDILATASAISRGDDAAGIRYLEQFRRPSVQRQEIRNFIPR